MTSSLPYGSPAMASISSATRVTSSTMVSSVSIRYLLSHRLYCCRSWLHLRKLYVIDIWLARPYGHPEAGFDILRKTLFDILRETLTKGDVRQ